MTITKNPGLGFSIAGGVGSYGNPFRPGDMVTHFFLLELGVHCCFMSNQQLRSLGMGPWFEVFLFVLILSLAVNNFSVMSGWVFLGWVEPVLGRG